MTLGKTRKNDVSGYYKLLGVSPNASDEELKSAARDAMRDAHPDAGGDTETFIKVSSAWRELSTPAKRAAYETKRPEVVSVSVGTRKEFVMPESAGEPIWYKEPQDILTQADIELVRAWQDMLLRTAWGFGAAIHIKAGISKSLAGYEIVDDVAVIGANETVPQRWAANLYVLKGMIDNVKSN